MHVHMVAQCSQCSLEHVVSLLRLMPVAYPNRLLSGYEAGTPGSPAGVSVLRCMFLCVFVACVLAILMCT